MFQSDCHDELNGPYIAKEMLKPNFPLIGTGGAHPEECWFRDDAVVNFCWQLVLVLVPVD